MFKSLNWIAPQLQQYAKLVPQKRRWFCSFVTSDLDALANEACASIDQSNLQSSRDKDVPSGNCIDIPEVLEIIARDQSGHVYSFNPYKGFGFICHGDNRVFVHRKDLKIVPGFFPGQFLLDAEKVTFDLARGTRSIWAVNVVGSGVFDKQHKCRNFEIPALLKVTIELIEYRKHLLAQHWQVLNSSYRERGIRGIVKQSCTAASSGLIRRLDNGTDVLLHGGDIRKLNGEIAGFTVPPGVDVLFDIVVHPQGPRAVNVTDPRGIPLLVSPMQQFSAAKSMNDSVQYAFSLNWIDLKSKRSSNELRKPYKKVPPVTAKTTLSVTCANNQFNYITDEL